MENKIPQWLEKDGERHLYAAEDVEAARANGWEDPKGVRGNGEPYNPAPVEGETPQVVHIAKAAQVKAAADAKKEKARAPKSAPEAKK